jgi:hypothetical protein
MYRRAHCSFPTESISFIEMTVRIAEISGGVWPPNGMLVTIALSAIMRPKARTLPPSHSLLLSLSVSDYIAAPED